MSKSFRTTIPMVIGLFCCLAVAQAQVPEKKVLTLDDVRQLIEETRSHVEFTSTQAWQRLHKVRSFIYEQANLDSAEAWYYLGYLDYRSLDRRPAETAFKKAIQLRPDYAEAYNGLAEYYKFPTAIVCLNSYTFPSTIDTKAYKMAIQHHQKAIQLKPQYADAYIGLGGAYSALNRYEEAAKAYETALNIAPEEFQIYENLADCYTQLGQPQKAIHIFELLTEKIPDDLAEKGKNGVWDYRGVYIYSAMDKLGATYFSLGQYPDALVVYKKLIKLDWSSFQAHYQLGLVYIALADKESALQQYDILLNKAGEWKPDDSRYKFYKKLADELFIKIQQ